MLIQKHINLLFIINNLIEHRRKWKIKATSYLRFSVVFVVKLVGVSGKMLCELEGRTSLLETAVLLKTCVEKTINF